MSIKDGMLMVAVSARNATAHSARKDRPSICNIPLHSPLIYPFVGGGHMMLQ